MTRLNNHAGYIVLITVLILGVIVSTIAAFLLISGSNASVASQAVEAGVQAKSAATGCAELALDAIQANPALTTPSTATQTIAPMLQETCTYITNGSSPNYTISVTGNVRQNEQNYTHQLTVATSQTSPNIIVSSWQDAP